MYSEKAQMFGFRQTLYACIAFVNTVSKTLRELMPDLPVFVLMTGDNNYIMDEKFQTVSNEVYEKTPRFVIKFDSFERDQSTDTAVFNRYVFLSQEDDNNDVCRAVIRRLCNYVVCQCTMVSPNFISAMTHMEMIYAIFSRENPFSYEYQGSTFNGGYTSEGNDFTFPEQDSGSRNFTQNISVKVQVHLYTPRVETIVRAKDLDYDEIGLQIIEKDVNNRDDSNPDEVEYDRTDTEQYVKVEDREDNEYPYTTTH